MNPRRRMNQLLHGKCNNNNNNNNGKQGNAGRRTKSLTQGKPSAAALGLGMRRRFFYAKSPSSRKSPAHANNNNNNNGKPPSNNMPPFQTYNVADYVKIPDSFYYNNDHDDHDDDDDDDDSFNKLKAMKQKKRSLLTDEDKARMVKQRKAWFCNHNHALCNQIEPSLIDFIKYFHPRRQSISSRSHP